MVGRGPPTTFIDDLLIATSQSVLALQRGVLDRVHQGFGIYYGISWDEKWVYVVARGSYRKPRPMEDVLVFDPDFNWIGSIQGVEFLDLHQIYFFDGQLFICNTGMDWIDILEGTDWIDVEEYECGDLGLARSAHHSTFRWDYSKNRRDVNHINSIWIDGDVIYVVEHRRGPSKVKYFDKKFKFLGEVEIGEKIHNVYVENGELFVCSSEAECIIIRDLSTGKDRIINTSQYVKGITRGLARTPGRWYIGVSSRETRDKRHLALDGVVLVFDDDFNLMHKIVLRNVGQVLEIRAMTGLDLAHNGIPFPKLQ